MGERISFFASVIMALVIIPVVVIGTFNKGVKIEKDPSLEDYLVGILDQQIPESYPMEAIKAQAVLARSTWNRQLQEGILLEEEWKYAAEHLRTRIKNGDVNKDYTNIRKAVIDTENEVLMYEDTICYGVFHRVSAGHTRNGKDIFENSIYDYITGVESVMDQESENYLTGHYFTPDFLEAECDVHGMKLDFSKGEEILVKTRDTAGYVQTVQIGEIICSGEELRQMLHLSSAAFSVDLYENKIRFLCRGQGHGMGLSQYGAKRMAEDGSTYREILKYYFPQAELIDIESE